jgi:hypothetical protein
MIFEPVGESAGTKRAASEIGVPDLVGSDADVSQAEAIRSRILIEADDVLTRLRSDEIITEAQVDTDIVSPRQVTDQQVHAAEVALNRLRHKSEAAWWIAQQDASAGDILSELMLHPETHP